MTGATGWPVVRYDGARDNRPRAEVWTLEEMTHVLGWPRAWMREKVAVPAWSPVEMVEGATRAAANVRSVSMLVLDCDAGDPLDVLEAMGSRYGRLGHTSWSHTPEQPKARLVFPFTNPCPVEHWARVWDAAAQWAASEGVTVDEAAKDPSRLYFLPYVPAGENPTPGGIVALEQYESWVHPGPWLSWARLAMEWPERVEEVTRYEVATTGAHEPTADERERRRRAFALGILRHRCAQIAAHGEGGRNVRVYAAARTAGSLAAGGWLVLAEAAAEIEAAGVAAGLSRKETVRAVRNGLAHGAADGAYDIDSHMTERIR